MTAPQADPAAMPPFSPNALRIVLVGMPDAGKSSLLGALAQASQTQERQLCGRINDPMQGLGELQKRVYEDRPRETLQEIVPYIISYEPFLGAKPDPDQKKEVVLFDCDGRVANDLLTQRKQLDESNAGHLAKAIADAHGLLMVVDASATHEQIASDLEEFTRFLRSFQQRRSRRTEVGGLPVNLVLTKCDLLAQPGDSQSAWQSRIEAKKNEVKKEFQGFLDASSNSAGFGTIDLNVTATAVKRPALGKSLPTKEPYQVAELFHDSFVRSGEYRDRNESANRRLTWTVLSAVLVLIGLVGGAAGLYFAHDQLKPNPLAAAVESYRAREGQTVADQLAEPLQRKISELAGFQQNPEFVGLPQELKSFVETRQAELTSYRKFRDRLLSTRPPGDLRSRDELANLEKELTQKLVPPAEFAERWRTTDALLLRDRWLADVVAIRSAATSVESWYAELRTEAARLLYLSEEPGKRITLPWPVWHEQLGKLLASASNPPFRPSDRLPNTKAEVGSRGALTYESVLALSEVGRARASWEGDRAKLIQLWDVTAALGLVAETPDRKAVLNLPESIDLETVRDRLVQLSKQYPRSAEWSLASLPDVVAPDIRAAAQPAYDRLLQVGQNIVHRKLQMGASDSKASPAQWRVVADWAGQSSELRDRQSLAMILLRLIGPAPDEPIAALRAFLRESSFTLQLRSLRLTIPDDAPAQRLRPFGSLTIHFQSDGKQTDYKFTQRGDGNRDPVRRHTVYTLIPDQPGDLTFTPGDEMWADLTLRDGQSKDWRLTWLQCRAAGAYSFERLIRTPRLHPADEANPLNGSLPKDLFLTVAPESGLPRVPDLLPVVKLRP